MTNPIDKELYPNFYEAYQYALDVTSKKQVACVYIIGSCQRFLNEFEEAQKKDSKYIFDIPYVERYLKLVQLFEHCIGEWATPNIVYVPWQKWVWSASLGFKHRDDPKRPKYRTLHIEVPRGASKSTMASQCALYFLGLDPSRAGEKIACFATKSEQSRIILDAARAMARKAKKYLDATGIEVLAHKIVDDKNFSEMVAMSSDSKSMDGLNLRIAFLDELHAMSRELFEVVVSGMKKRNNSLTICVTTAGFSLEGVGFSQSQYAKKVALQHNLDETFFSAVYTIDEGDDIFQENTWRKANPNYGVSVDPIAFEATANKAKVTPSDLPNFKVKSLNVWLGEASSFFSIKSWDSCADENLKLEDFKGQKCYIGIDLASKIDLTSLAIVFRKDGIYYIFDKSFIPEQTLLDLKNDILTDCASNGFLKSTPGEAIHYPKIEEEFLLLSKQHKILAGMYDPWNCVSFSQKMESERINMLEYRMTTSNLSEPTKTLDALIREGKVRHNGSPLLRWCLGNVVCKPDAADNIFPRKSNDRLKIDPIVATIMALSGWLSEEVEESVYEKRGVRRL